MKKKKKNSVLAFNNIYHNAYIMKPITIFRILRIRGLKCTSRAYGINPTTSASIVRIAVHTC